MGARASQTRKAAAPKTIAGSGAAADKATARRSSNSPGRLAANKKSRATSSTTIRQAVAGLTAAAQVLDNKGKNKVNGDQSATRSWQHAVTAYGHIVPELSAGKMYVGNCLARVVLRVGKRNPDGSVEPGYKGEEPVDGLDATIAGMAAEVIQSIRSQIGGQSELLRSFGEKAFTVGESFLLPQDSPAGLTFDVLSTQELQKDGGRWKVNNGPGTDPEFVPDGIEPVRIWRPDDVYRKQATSSVRACLEVLEELVLLTKLVRSSAISRMALAGILAISEEFDDPIDEEGEDGSTSESANPLLVDIILNGAKAIDDPASAASWLPYLLSGPTELIEKGIRFIEFKHDDAINVVKRREALERLAQGLDLPFEVILGHQGTTFANAQVISEDTFRVHLEPMVQLFCDAVTLGILWPALARKKGLTAEQVAEGGYPDEILSVAVTYDAGDLISVPDKAKEIVELFTKDVTQMSVGIREVRDAVGLDPDGFPDEAEVGKRLDAYRIAKMHETAQVAVTGAEGQLNADEGAAARPGPVVSGQAAAEGAGVTASLYLAEGMATKIAGIAEFSIERCAERLGSALRPKLAKDQQLADRVREHPNSELTRVLGPTVVARFIETDSMIAAELRSVERQVEKWASEAGQRHPGQLARAVTMVLEENVIDRLFSAVPAQPEPGALEAVAAACA